MPNSMRARHHRAGFARTGVLAALLAGATLLVAAIDTSFHSGQATAGLADDEAADQLATLRAELKQLRQENRQLAESLTKEKLARKKAEAQAAAEKKAKDAAVVAQKKAEEERKKAVAAATAEMKAKLAEAAERKKAQALAIDKNNFCPALAGVMNASHQQGSFPRLAWGTNGDGGAPLHNFFS